MADVHVLDEAEHVPRAAEVLRERDDAVVVRAALHDRVDLHAEAGRCGGVDAVENALHREVGVVERAEGGVVDRIEADRHAVEPGARERLRFLREERAVRGHRQLELRDGA